MNEITASKIKVFTWWSNNFGGLMMQKPRRKLLDIVRDKIRVKHYSMSTERTYIHWIKHYIFFHNKKHPIEMGKEEIEQFLTFLAVQKKVSPTTQNQAFSAILFLYKEVLGIDMSSWNIQALRAQERKHIPQVLTKEEVQKVIAELTGVYQLIVHIKNIKGSVATYAPMPYASVVWCGRLAGVQAQGFVSILAK